MASRGEERERRGRDTERETRERREGGEGERSSGVGCAVGMGESVRCLVKMEGSRFAIYPLKNPELSFGK